MAKCPKCGVEVAAKKTWKMAGRPDKKGKRTQLHIGLFECQKHGTFRAVLAKRKI
ncbi:chorismate-binding protein [Candidatus Bathyarchaeota archaeon]|nr:chorismate-binding protein [Candidatus Bathyarchaeota archaeon]